MEQAGRDSLEKHARDPMPEADSVPLRGIVKERGRQEIARVMACGEQLSSHVEGVAPVGDRHPLEERHGVRGQVPRGERCLLLPNSRSDMGNELPDPMHRSVPA